MENYSMCFVNETSQSNLIDDLVNRGFTILRFNGGDCVETFFDAIKRSLPLDPPIYRLNWNAFTDSVWNGIDDLGPTSIAIVWEDSDELAINDDDSYSAAIRCFNYILTDFKSEFELKRTLVENVIVVIVGNRRSKGVE